MNKIFAPQLLLVFMLMCIFQVKAKANPNAEIELSGHTSSEGDANFNRSLSYKRIKACKDYILLQGVDSGRIITIGFGPDRAVAPNDSETNRAKNRRVEMRFMKL